MRPSANRFLCVSVHDVAPATWPECQRLLAAVRAVDDIPVTLLIVPQFHGWLETPAGYVRKLDDLLARGHELALHGYTHWDSGPAQAGWRQRFLRTVYTQREGEFAAIDVTEARRRIGLGLDWFRARHWPVAGFVAPAWLLGEGGWRALREFPFEYTTTLGRFYLLPERYPLWSPSLVYTARNAGGRLISPRWAEILALSLKTAPLARLSLHPRDAHFPELVIHFQGLLENLLEQRTPLTKISFARRLRRQIISAAAAAKAVTASPP